MGEDSTTKHTKDTKGISIEKYSWEILAWGWSAVKRDRQEFFLQMFFVII